MAADGAFLAFTCGMAARADVWFSGDWYRGRLVDEPVIVSGPDGEQFILSRTPEGGLTGAVTGSDHTGPAAPADKQLHRDDADGVLGAVALPGNTVCAVKRTADGRFLPSRDGAVLIPGRRGILTGCVAIGSEQERRREKTMESKAKLLGHPIHPC